MASPRRASSSPETERQAERAAAAVLDPRLSMPALAPMLSSRAAEPLHLGPGQPLPVALQRPMSAALRYDLSAVRLHTGPEAARLTEQHQARALTVGSQIAFAAGAWSPRTPEGLGLLAHELAHVVQQRGQPVALQRAAKGQGPDVPGLWGEAWTAWETAKRLGPAARDALQPVLRDPEAALGTLASGVKLGAREFGADIDTHLKVSLWSWLFGQLRGGAPPISRSPTALLGWLAERLGLSGDALLNRLTALGLSLDHARRLASSPGALWGELAGQAAEIKQALLDTLRAKLLDLLIGKAITWALSLFSPAGGVLAAVRAVGALLENARELLGVAEVALAALAKVATRDVRAVATAVREAMVRSLGPLLSFAASMAGIQDVPARVAKAIDGLGERVRSLLDQAMSARAGPARAAVEARLGMPKDPQARLKLAADDAVWAARHLSGRVTRAALGPALELIRLRYRLASIAPEERAGRWWIRAKINPEVEVDTGVVADRSDPTTASGAAKHEDPTRLGALGLKRPKFATSTKQALVASHGERLEDNKATHPLKLSAKDWQKEILEKVPARAQKELKELLDNALGPEARDTSNRVEKFLTSRRIDKTTRARIRLLLDPANVFADEGKGTLKGLGKSHEAVWARRHIVSISALKIHYESYFPDMSVAEARAAVSKILHRSGWEDGHAEVRALGPTPNKDAESVKGAIRVLHEDFFNHLENLWIGQQVENRVTSDKLDAPPEWSIDQVHAHINKLERLYGVPDRELKIMR